MSYPVFDSDVAFFFILANEGVDVGRLRRVGGTTPDTVEAPQGADARAAGSNHFAHLFIIIN